MAAKKAKSAKQKPAPEDFRSDALALALEKMRQLMLQLREGDKPHGVASGVDLEQIAKRLTTIPAGRVGSARELGWLATFLCSGYANFITGQVIVLDGANWLRRWHSQPFENIRESYDRRAAAAKAGSQ